jgi:hypothetical protein
MPDPRDHELFALTSAAAKDGLAFIERRVSAKSYIKTYDDLPSVTWSEEGVPDFSFGATDAPTDYKDAFNMGIYRLFDRYSPEELFDFDKRQPYKDLKKYIRSSPDIASHFYPPDIDGDMFDSSVEWFLKQAIDRYIQIFGHTSFDSDKFLTIYLPLEVVCSSRSCPLKYLSPSFS